MKKTLTALACAAALAVPAAAMADETGFSIQVGPTSLKPANKSDAIVALGVPADAIHVSSKTIPEIDIIYGFTPNLVAQVVLTIPQSHTVSLSGTDIGSFKELPPTFLAQWHFLPGQTFDPYVGAGLNLTLISGVNLAVPGVGSLDLNKSSVGFAYQAGARINIDKQMFVTVDYKHAAISSDVKLSADGTKVSTVHVDPGLIGVAVGMHF
jgi:outer membrane protein